MMKPYFDTNHLAGLLLLIAVLAWGMMELGALSQGQERRKGATRIRQPSFWLAAIVCTVAVSVVLYAAPHLFAAATIRNGAAAFAVGMVTLLGGIALRGWSFKALGEYFTFSVKVSSDQPVITTGPYRLLRHPSYTGVLLACAGIGLASANWAGLAGLVLLPLALILWRIHTEEKALLATLGDRYRSYALQRRRLIPLVW
jgi:protein-S-isoprenylcysteine O-methyltransferase Ste14